MKRIKMDNHNGFSLIEVLVAITILCIGLLGMVGLTVGIIYSNKASSNITTATILAQNMMEDMQRLGVSLLRRLEELEKLCIEPLHFPGKETFFKLCELKRSLAELHVLLFDDLKQATRIWRKKSA